MISRLLPWKNVERDIQELSEKVESLDAELDQLFDLAQGNREQVSELGEDTARLDQVVEDLREEVFEEETIELDGMEQEIFKVLMKAETELTNSEIGERLEPERTGDQVRPKINSLKDKIPVLEDQKGRAKAYAIPSKTKTDYLEKGKIAEIEN